VLYGTIITSIKLLKGLLKMKKSNIVSFIMGASLFCSIGVFAGQYNAVKNSFPIQLNGENIFMEGYNIDGNTYFKLRDIANATKLFNVDFQNNTILLSKDGYTYSNDVTSYSYAEFEKLFSEQEYLLDDNLSMHLGDSISTVDLANGIGASTEFLQAKIFDIANVHLVEYAQSYELTMEEVESLCNVRYNEIIAEGERNHQDFWTGGSMDTLTRASSLWQASKDILKQYYYELYKHTGKVEIDLNFG